MKLQGCSPSPHIQEIHWGHMEVDDLGEGRDFKLWPGGGRPWDWNETGTKHSPGIQQADVEELLDHGALIVILTQGMERRLETAPETIQMLDRLGVEWKQMETKEGAMEYNRLAQEGRAVGGLFHSTC